MQRLQNALTKQLTDEHERIDLKLREKVCLIVKFLKLSIKGRRSQENKKEERRGRCTAIWCLASAGKDADYF